MGVLLELRQPAPGRDLQRAQDPLLQPPHLGRVGRHAAREVRPQPALAKQLLPVLWLHVVRSQGGGRELPSAHEAEAEQALRHPSRGDLLAGAAALAVQQRPAGGEGPLLHPVHRAPEGVPRQHAEPLAQDSQPRVHGGWHELPLEQLQHPPLLAEYVLAGHLLHEHAHRTGPRRALQPVREAARLRRERGVRLAEGGEGGVLALANERYRGRARRRQGRDGPVAAAAARVVEVEEPHGVEAPGGGQLTVVYQRGDEAQRVLAYLSQLRVWLAADLPGEGLRLLLRQHLGVVAGHRLLVEAVEVVLRQADIVHRA
mmetsp:Transcript_90354/g.244938  ORF Transcript_90354/g.244938 Transcript_90354/m.244938 type:complete len:315 (-) Transcript_90354:73-1017(-)